MKALSLTQPMAWAIFHGKDVENRPWSTKFRGRLYIHASKGFNKQHHDWIWLHHGLLKLNLPTRISFVHGAIIGEVDIVDCVTEHHSPWFSGPYGFVLANPTLYSTPIPCRGFLGIFTPVLPPQEAA